MCVMIIVLLFSELSVVLSYRVYTYYTFRAEFKSVQGVKTSLRHRTADFMIKLSSKSVVCIGPYSTSHPPGLSCLLHSHIRIQHIFTLSVCPCSTQTLYINLH